MQSVELERRARKAILRLHFWCRSHLALSIVNLNSSRGRQKRNSYTATSVIGKSGKKRAEGRETRGWKILWDNAVEQRGWAIVSPRLSYRPRQWWFLLSFLQFPRPSPFTLHGAAGTFSRLASKRRTAHTRYPHQRRTAFSIIASGSSPRSIHDPSRRIHRFRTVIGNIFASDLTRVSDVTLTKISESTGHCFTKKKLANKNLSKKSKSQSYDRLVQKRYFGAWRWLITSSNVWTTSLLI